MADFVRSYSNLFQDNVFLNGVLDIRITLTKDAKSNTMELRLIPDEIFQSGELLIKDGDKLAVYATSEGLVDRINLPQDQLLGTFVVLNNERDVVSNTIKLICSDLTYNLLNNIYTQIYEESDGKTAKSIVNNIVQIAGSDDSGITQESITVNLQNTKNDGTAFPAKSFTSVYKTGYEAISEPRSKSG